MYVRMYVLTHVQQLIATGLPHSLSLPRALEVSKVTAPSGGGSGGGQLSVNRQPFSMGLSVGGERCSGDRRGAVGRGGMQWRGEACSGEERGAVGPVHCRPHSEDR